MMPTIKTTSNSLSSSTKKTSRSVRYHTLKEGDNLTKIAIRYYSNAAMWRKIGDANKIKNPRKLKVGMKLKLP